MAILGLMLLMLAVAGYIIASKPTRLGLDLRGGTELIYEGRPTPKVPQVTSEAINDAIETIRSAPTRSASPSRRSSERARADLGQPAGRPNAQRAKDQVGTTAQLQFYDWEPNVLGKRGPDAPYSGSQALYRAAIVASRPGRRRRPLTSRRAERVGGDRAQVRRRPEEDPGLLRQAQRHRVRPSTTVRGGQAAAQGQREAAQAGRRLPARLELQGAARRVRAEGGQPKQYANDTACAKELKALEGGGPPAGSRVIRCLRAW